MTVEPRVYITGPGVPQLERTESDSGSFSADTPISENEKDVKNGLPAYSALAIINGRPSVRKIFDEEIPVSSGPVSVDG